MSCNQDCEWKFESVETADGVISCGRDATMECNRLQNWNRWLKIRKQQHKYLGLKVCRSSTSLIMNKSDKYRSKVEFKWMVDQARKLKSNNEHNKDFQYPVAEEMNNFTSIFIPDVVQNEKGISNARKDIRENVEMQTPNAPLYKELCALKSMRSVKSPEKLIVVGKNIMKERLYRKCYFKGTIPSIHVEPADDNKKCDQSVPIAFRINDIVIKSVDYGGSAVETLEMSSKPTLFKIVDVNEESWDEIVVENRGEISIRFKWGQKENSVTTKYRCVAKQRSIRCFYFDTRPTMLGPGQIQRLPILFKPKRIGPHRETWFFEVNVLGRSDPVARIKISLQGCAIPTIDYETRAIQLQKTILAEKSVVSSPKSIDEIGKYQTHKNKMMCLYRVLQTDKRFSIDELLWRCMQLEQSFRELFVDLISHTAVALLKKKVVFGHSQTTLYELNAHKTMYIALDCIDLIINTYEPDYDKACQQLKLNASRKNVSKRMESLENEKSIDVSEEKAIRLEWLKFIEPMIFKRLEWALERIFNFNNQECKHNELRK